MRFVGADALIGPSPYTFHRLIAGADEVWLYWQEGVETSGLFDGKKQRSRLYGSVIKTGNVLPISVV